MYRSVLVLVHECLMKLIDFRRLASGPSDVVCRRHDYQTSTSYIVVLYSVHGYIKKAGCVVCMFSLLICPLTSITYFVQKSSRTRIFKPLCDFTWSRSLFRTGFQTETGEVFQILEFVSVKTSSLSCLSFLSSSIFSLSVCNLHSFRHDNGYSLPFTFYFLDCLSKSLSVPGFLRSCRFLFEKIIRKKCWISFWPVAMVL